MEKNLISELIARLRTQNPAFFKKLQLAALIIGGVSAFLGYIISHGAAMPQWVTAASQELSKACALLVVFGFLPNKDINQTDK